MSYRHSLDLLSDIRGRAARRLRSLISRRQLALDDSDGERVTALGREAMDGSVEEDEMDGFGPVGLASRPAADTTVEAAVAFVGADGAHPIALSYLDGQRRIVINAVGLDADETLVYTSQAVVKLCADGTVEIRSLSGSAKRLATAEEVKQLRDEFLAHTHTTPQGPSAGPENPPGMPILEPKIPIVGTAVLRAE